MSAVVAPAEGATKRTTHPRKRHCMSIEDARIAQELGTRARSLCGKAWIWPKRGEADVRSTADLTPNHCATCRKIVAAKVRRRAARRARLLRLIEELSK